MLSRIQLFPYLSSLIYSVTTFSIFFIFNFSVDLHMFYKQYRAEHFCNQYNDLWVLTRNLNLLKYIVITNLFGFICIIFLFALLFCFFDSHFLPFDWVIFFSFLFSCYYFESYILFQVSLTFLTCIRDLIKSEVNKKPCHQTI